MDSSTRDILKNKKVGIAGCGGLGSNCAVGLARVGVGRLIVADFDVVSESNLNRQYFFRDQIGTKKAFALRDNIRRIDTQIQVDAHDRKLDKPAIAELFGGCDVIVEAFDLTEMKLMIVEAVSEFFPEKPLVAGSGLAGWGDNESLKTLRLGNITVCGDGKTEVSDQLPPLGPRVAIVANMQANVVLEILLSNQKV
ncbi:MAG: sulfur carrier protein ThiS adenylyltransferase ThiF [Bacteroidetes bacterium]|nr:sulfur carrier protein ThiS adenylyltransferase ThiF [Bacteroidota bacterium]MBU1717810.1 sulfur carrier protein ThiS adenylyltransferase ThiF [Bacteroidota bacterium]